MNLNSGEDKAFLNRITGIAEANLSNEQFGVNELASKTGLSRSQIHRKLKSICNKSVSQFIREIRLEKAKEFLKQGNFTVSEIAYKVGFGSPSYFIKSFHDYFGYPPGEYVKYVSEDSVKKENEVTNAKSIQENKDNKSLFKIFSIINKRVLVVLIVFVLVISGILIIVKKYGSRELSIAVLPVENLTGQNDNEYIAYGVQDQLITELGKLKELRVISKTSSRGFDDKMMLMKDIARKLNVDLAVEVSLIGVGDSIEILLKLVDVFPKERPVLSTEYKTDLQDIWQIYSSAARDIAARLHLNLADDVILRLNKFRKINPKSLEAYFRGKYLLGKDDIELFDEAIKYIKEAIDIDPEDPFAYAAVALGYAIKGHHSYTSQEDFAKAGYYAEKALALDPSIEEAITAIAMLNLYQGWQWDKAKDAFNEAIKINPNNDVAHAHFAWYYVVRCDFENAIYHAKKAVILNPLYIGYNAWLAAIYFRAGEYNNAEFYAKKVLAERDSSVYANIILGWINLLRKNYPEAIEFTEKLPNWDYWNLYRAYTYDKSGDKEKALSFRNAMEEKAKNRYVLAWHRGLMAAIFGFKEEAFKYLNLAIDKKQYQMMYINWYPFTESLRKDPRYNKLLERMNLPPYKEK